MKKNIKRKILGISLTLLILNLNIQPVIAASLSFSGMASDSSGETEEIEFEEWKESKKRFGNKKYEYTYKKEIKETVNIEMNVYPIEKNGDSAIPGDIKELEEIEFKAGTWAGISVIENHQVTWRVFDIQYREVKANYICIYKKPKTGTCTSSATTHQDECSGTFTPNYPGAQYGICKTTYTCGTGEYEEIEVPITKDFYDSTGCDTTYNGYSLLRQEIPPTPDDTTTSDFVPPAIKNQLKEEAKQTAKDMAYSLVSDSSSAIVKYITNNDYPKDEEDLEYRTIPNENSEGTNLVNRKEIDNGMDGMFKADFEYLEQKVCMNMKTAKVRYGEDCNSDEIQINNGTANDGKKYWHYFIPLNMKSDKTFSLNIIKNGDKKYSINQCKNFMDEHDDYNKYIVPTSTTEKPVTFEGDYEDDIDLFDNGEANGCQLAVKIDLQISQEFYKETKVDDKLKFKGYNFFYKPIDPKTFSVDSIISPSLWEKWTGSNPNISESFSEITYETEIISRNKAKEVRNYNKDDANVYTSWQSITTNGTSNFITDEKVIVRKNPKSYYKLGCGLANSDSTNKMLFIEGCDVKS